MAGGYGFRGFLYRRGRWKTHSRSSTSGADTKINRFKEMFGSPAFETRRSINRCGIQKRTCAAYASIIMCVVSFAASRWWSLSMFSTLRLHHELVTVSLCSLPWCHLWSCWSNFEFFTIRKALNWKETKPTNHHIRMMPSASLHRLPTGLGDDESTHTSWCLFYGVLPMSYLSQKLII